MQITDTITFKYIYAVCSGSLVCSGSVDVTAYDFESGRPGSNPEWRLIYYKALITAQGTGLTRAFIPPG